MGELPHGPVINCLFTPDKPFRVHVSLSKNPSDTTSYNLNNARVMLFGDDGTEEYLPFAGNGYYSKSTVIPVEGVAYTLKVNVPGMDEASATGSISPNTIRITGIESKSGFETN